MGAVVTGIADAVTAALNGASLTPTFTAVRIYVPITELSDPAALSVFVIPAELTGTLLTRGSQSLYTYEIDIGVYQSIGQGAMTTEQIAEAADPLMLLIQSIIDLFIGKPLTGYTQAICIMAKNVPIFDPEWLDQKRVFASPVRLSFRLGR